jgi:hypothetical protein
MKLYNDQRNAQVFNLFIYVLRGTRWRSWLRHCATNRKVAGSIPDDVTGIFHWHNPSGRTLALGLTQTVTEMRTRVKTAGALGWQPYHLHMPIVLKAGSLKLLEPSGPVKACNGIALRFSVYFCLTCFELSFSPGRWHHTQETWTTAEVVHLPLKMG